MPRPYCPSCPNSKLSRGRALHLDDPDYGKDFFACKKCNWRFALDDPNLPLTPVPNPTIDRWYTGLDRQAAPTKIVSASPKRRSAIWQAPRRELSPQYFPSGDTIAYTVGQRTSSVLPSLPPSPPAPSWDELEDDRRRERLQRILASPGLSTIDPPSLVAQPSVASSVPPPDEEARRDRLNKIALSPNSVDLSPLGSLNLPDSGRHAQDMARRERLRRIAATPLVTPREAPIDGARSSNAEPDDFDAVRRHTDDITSRLDDLIRKSPWQRFGNLTPRASPASGGAKPAAPNPDRQPSPADSDTEGGDLMFGRAPGSDLPGAANGSGQPNRKASPAAGVKWGADPANKAAMTPLPPSPEKKSSPLPSSDGSKKLTRADVERKANEAAASAEEGKATERDEEKVAAEEGSASPVFG